MKAIKRRRLREKGIKGSQDMTTVMEYHFLVYEKFVDRIRYFEIFEMKGGRESTKNWANFHERNIIQFLKM